MAKYSLLLVGKNKVIIGEFFTHLRDDFECLSCSGRFEDIRNHLKYFKPNALVYCLQVDSFDEMQQVVSAKTKIEDDNIPLVVIGQSEDCDEFCRYSPNAADQVIEKNQMPITQVGVRLNKFLGGWQTEVNGNRPEERYQSDDQMLFAAMKSLNLELPPDIAAKVNRSVRKNILVVDDNPMMLKVIKETLRDNYEVATAISGSIARKYLSNKSVDLILLDYEMPGESGSEVLEKLRKDEATKDIPVIFLTGVKEKTKIQKALQLKPQGYLLKPIEHDKLIEVIKNQLG